MLVGVLILLAGVASARAAPPTSPALPSNFYTIYEQVLPSVVAIARVRRDRANVMAALPFNQPRGILPGESRPWEFLPTELGTGVAISPNEVVTCWHLLDDPKLNDYWVWRPGADPAATMRPLPATVRAGDPWTDLAVIKVDNANLSPVAWGEPHQVRIGHLTLVLTCSDSALRNQPPSASLGMVSNLQQQAPRLTAKNEGSPSSRESLHQYGTLMQLDTRLNRGISGGAVFDLEGKLIGLTTSLVDGWGNDAAAGYAIPLDGAARKAIETMRSGKSPEYGFLGVEPIDIEPSLISRGVKGALIQHLVRGFPGEAAGLHPGEIVTAIDGASIDGANDLFREISRRPAHSSVKLTVTRLDRNGPLAPWDLVAVLGKKNTPTKRPAYSIEVPRTWRGLRADWSTALSPDRMLAQQLERPPPVAISAVDSDSQAWRAGVRPSMFVLTVDGNEVKTPQDFFEKLDLAGAQTVSLRVIGDGGRPQTAEISP